jgi:hypothetical protein
MNPPAKLIKRILGKSKFFTLYYSEPESEPRTMQLLDALETREYRHLNKRIRHSPFPEAKHVLVLNCNLRLPANMRPSTLADFLSKLEPPSFSHRACYTTLDMNQVIYSRLTAVLDPHAGLVAYLRDLGTCTFYPVKQGERLMVAYFAS